MLTSKKLISALSPGQRFRINIRVSNNVVIELDYYRGRLKTKKQYQILLFRIVVKVSDFVLWHYNLTGHNEMMYNDVEVELI
jgi:hypothetical protein